MQFVALPHHCWLLLSPLTTVAQGLRLINGLLQRNSMFGFGWTVGGRLPSALHSAGMSPAVSLALTSLGVSLALTSLDSIVDGRPVTDAMVHPLS